MSVFINQDHTNQKNSAPSSTKLIFMTLFNMPDFIDDYICGLPRFSDVINGDDVVVNHQQSEQAVLIL